MTSVKYTQIAESSERYLTCNGIRAYGVGRRHMLEILPVGEVRKIRRVKLQYPPQRFQC